LDQKGRGEKGPEGIYTKLLWLGREKTLFGFLRVWLSFRMEIA
jgi:hypothetical protein